jgi:hypothetical protein
LGEETVGQERLCIGTGVETSVNDRYRRLATLTGFTAPIERRPHRSGDSEPIASTPPEPPNGWAGDPRLGSMKVYGAPWPGSNRNPRKHRQGTAQPVFTTELVRIKRKIDLCTVHES